MCQIDTQVSYQNKPLPTVRLSLQFDGIQSKPVYFYQAQAWQQAFTQQITTTIGHFFLPLFRLMTGDDPECALRSRSAWACAAWAAALFLLNSLISSSYSSPTYVTDKVRWKITKKADQHPSFVFHFALLFSMHLSQIVKPGMQLNTEI